MSRRGCQESAPPVGEIRLAHWLGQWPLPARRTKLRDAVPIEYARFREVGDVGDVHGNSPGIARHPTGRRCPLLGRMAVPLGPGRLLSVRQIEATDDGAGLPAAVGGVGRPEERIASASVDPPPDAVDGDPGGGGSVQENESFSSSATSLETSL